LVEDVVLGEGAVGRVFRNLGGRQPKRIQDHHDAGDATIGLGLLGQEIVSEREIGLARIALGEIDLTVMGAESGEIGGQRQGVGVGGPDVEPCDQRRADDPELRHGLNPLL
jgi:hypothetical protein